MAIKRNGISLPGYIDRSEIADGPFPGRGIGGDGLPRLRRVKRQVGECQLPLVLTDADGTFDSTYLDRAPFGIYLIARKSDASFDVKRIEVEGDFTPPSCIRVIENDNITASQRTVPPVFPE